MTETGNFGYLGYNFQVKLINLIISDKSFAQSILDVVESKYYSKLMFLNGDPYHSQLPALIQEFSSR